MIVNPANEFETIQNEVAQRIMSAEIFQNLTMPDGTPWVVLTEDEGAVESVFRDYIANCGLGIRVNCPLGSFDPAYLFNSSGPRFSPMEFDVLINEAVLYNRNGGTGVRLSSATKAVAQMLMNWTPPTTNIPIRVLRIVSDKSELLPDGNAIVMKRRVECDIPGVPLGKPDIVTP